jgi:hypothetical protein
LEVEMNRFTRNFIRSARDAIKGAIGRLFVPRAAYEAVKKDLAEAELLLYLEKGPLTWTQAQKLAVYYRAGVIQSDLVRMFDISENLVRGYLKLAAEAGIITLRPAPGKRDWEAEMLEGRKFKRFKGVV